MGLFSTKSSSGATRRTSSDAQIREMRSRARRRLIGALVLVLAAILIVPFLTSNEPEPEQSQLLAVIPTPIQPNEFATGTDQLAQAPVPAEPLTDQSEGTTNSGSTLNDDFAALIEPEPEPPVVVDPTPAEPVAEPKPTPTAPPVVKQPEPKPKPEPKPTPSKPEPSSERTDDGSVALALLEGRTPPTTNRPATAAPQGNFILQIVAYSAETEAQSRRNQLVSAGVTNAYVETANSAGKTTYRLRVGPFPTREAAQAAQTRLRSLGYENSFISTK